MQRLLPFAKTLVRKTLVQNPIVTTPLYSRKTSTTLLRTVITGNRNLCSGGKQKGPENANPKGPRKDPWSEPWDEDAAKYSWKVEVPASEEEEEPSVLKAIGTEDEDGEEGEKTVRDDGEGGFEGPTVPGGGFGDEEEWTKIEKAFGANIERFQNCLQETPVLVAQALEPGRRGAYLKDSEKQEMYRLHKENPEVYTVERLAKDFRIMRQRVHAILWLKEDEEEMEKRIGPLDDSVEKLLDYISEYIDSADREFHVAQLPQNPDFKVMPENWDGTVKDPDEMLWEISQKEDEMLYQEFVQRMNYNKAKIAGMIKSHPYSRRRPSEGWKFTIEEMGEKGKRGRGGGRKFVGESDGSKRPLNELEKMFLKRETNRTRRKII